MARQLIKPGLPVLVFTDLDGTLLDHHDYSFGAAVPALQRLRGLHIPIIPTTSKTLAELEILNRALDNPHPCIVENGSALCIPRGYFEDRPGTAATKGYEVLRLAPEYGDLIATLHGLRRERGFHFRGFHDMTAEQVAADTGLSLDAATRARERLCSEPLVWEDTLEALDRFRSALDEIGLSLTRGGRYWHVMAGQSKAAAMRRMLELYEAAGGDRLTTIALGDSPNDADMLRAAEIAVIVRRPDGSHLDYEDSNRTLRSRATGPAGWNECMQILMDELIPAHQQNDVSRGGRAWQRKKD